MGCASAMRRYFCFLVTLILSFCCGFGQDLPPVACPDNFEYRKIDHQITGRVSVVLDGSKANLVQVEFSQPDVSADGDPGEIKLMGNEATVMHQLQNNEKVNFLIKFPLPDVVPKLTGIVVNGETICQASPYDPPSLQIFLTHTVSTIIPLAAQPLPRPQGIPVFDSPRLLPAVTPPPLLPPTQQPRPQPLPQLTQPMTSTNPPTIRRVNNAPQTIGQLRTVCGREKPIQTAFIHFGEVVQQGQFPWMVALLERIGNEYSFTCGGTLISARTVISAAHCFRFGSKSLSAARTVVSLGRNSLDIFSPGDLKGVSELVLHHQYDVNTHTDADLALLQLTNQVQFTDYIKPICLWNDNYLLDLPSGHKSYVAGWGEDEHGNKNTRLAKMTSTDIITQTECRGNLTFENVRFVTSNTICASNAKASGPCSGDSGGGLMLEEQDIWMLRGVVSSGQKTSKGCDLTKPVIYTDVARHIDWLLKTMWF
ncbi:brain-specific serine protease 4 [Drosophila kikkawai]|uniref:Brain-specific serine protease 4 n=1 Tax=Drosophila kikkawai TaxID=30033 RepID=A0A6P4IJF9_DROKI|nr:transmembrane protease serine 9 [Drosophila kikkawai]